MLLVRVPVVRAPGEPVLQGADVVQRNLAQKDGKQDVALELIEPAPDAADFVLGKDERSTRRASVLEA